MKKYFSKLLMITLLVIFNCEDNDKSPFPITYDGSFVTLEIDNLILDITQLETTAVTGLLKSAVDNVASYDLQVQWTSAASGGSSDFVNIYSTNSFPTNLSIGLNDIAASLGITLDDFGSGDRFDFVATSTSTDGSVTDWSNINGDLKSESGQLQSYRFTSYISCPLDTSLVEGTYEVIALGFNDFFGEPALGTGTRTVVNGPKANQITIVEGEFPATGMSDPLILDIDPGTGIVTGGGLDEDGEEEAIAFVEGTNGLPENTYIVRDGGFYFSCIGSIDLNLNFSPFTANAHKFVLRKISE